MNYYIRFPGVKKITGLSRTTIWRLEKIGGFPRRRQLSAGAVGWLKAEIDHWMESRSVKGE